ncbi:MAG: hydroxymethylglutaryl-CoA lyase [Candidatus Dormibacteria bacterium]
MSAQLVSFTEVGPRDGFQNWPDPVSTETKVQMIGAALAAGVPRVEATAMVSPRWVPQMADAAEVLSALAPAQMERVRVLVPNLQGYERAVTAGARNVLVNVGATEGFNKHNLNRTVDETVEEIGAICRRAADEQVRVDASLSVVWGCPFDGRVPAHQVHAVLARLVAAGCRELSLGDTIGVATPSAVRPLVRDCLERYPGVELSLHFHDTRGMALANVLVALDAGARAFEGSIGGIGGCPFAPNSTGNVCSEDLLEMVDDLGYRTGIDIDAMCEAARAASSSLGAVLPGRLHRAGRAPWLTPVGA